MPAFDFQLCRDGVVVSSGEVWLNQQPPVGRIEFSTGDTWWQCTNLVPPASTADKATIVCKPVPVGTPDPTMGGG